MVEPVDEPVESDLVLTVPPPVPRRAFGRGGPSVAPVIMPVGTPAPAVSIPLPMAAPIEAVPPAVPPPVPPVVPPAPVVEPIRDDAPAPAWPDRDWWVSTGTSLVVHVVVLTVLALLVPVRPVDTTRRPFEIVQQVAEPDEAEFLDVEEVVVEVVAVEPEPVAEEPVAEAAAALVADATDVAADAGLDAAAVDPGLVAVDAAGMLAAIGGGAGAGGANDGAGGFGGDVGRRLARAGAKTGDIQVSLSWDNFNDLDLHVITPEGERIWFARRRSRCRGMLDVDMNAAGPATREPVENVFWPARSAPRGEYQVFVHHFARYDAAADTAFEVHVLVDGIKRRYSGSVAPGEPPTLVTRFERTGRAPPSGDEFVE